MGRWPPAPWAGPCCTQSCERRSTWREQPRWESEATTRQLRCLGTCFFSIHLLVCSHLFTVAGLTQQTERNPPQELETKGAWAEQKRISDNSEISLRKFMIILDSACLSEVIGPGRDAHGEKAWKERLAGPAAGIGILRSIFNIWNMQYAICKQFYILSAAL